MSDVLSATVADSAAAPPGLRPDQRSRQRWIALAAAFIVVGGAVAALITIGPFSASKPAPVSPVVSTGLATVTQRSLTSQTQVNATLGYAGSYNVVIPAQSSAPSAGDSGSTGASRASQGTAGTFTALPAVGQVVSQGQRLYSIDDAPTVLLYGGMPAYRSLSEGMSGSDVQELNADLVALGDATTAQLDPGSDYFGTATAAAVEKLQSQLGTTQTGVIPMGQALFLPGAVRITSVSATLGGPAQASQPVLQATSTTRQVVAHLDANQQSDVKAGDNVAITLPDGHTTPAVVTSVGTVATAPPGSSSSPSSSSGGTGSTPTIEVDIRPTDPAATGTLDQAPVTVTITTAAANNALVVPVDALLAQARGGYAVEVVDPTGVHRLVAVSLGLFDDADGLVQVTGSGLRAGQHVVVPEL